jgi:D-alanyl-D-alanine carboxypeptidase
VLNKMLLEPLQLDETYYRPRVPPKRVLDAMTSAYDNESHCEELYMLPPPCAQQPLDDLLGQDLKTINLSVYGAAGGIVASLPDVTSWVRAMFGDQLLPPQQQTELFSLVSEISGQPIATTSSADPDGYTLGVWQAWASATGSPIWYYGGETFGSRVQWYRLPGDDLVVVIGVNSAVLPADSTAVSSLYQTLLGILEPQSDQPERPAAGAAGGLAAREGRCAVLPGIAAHQLLQRRSVRVPALSGG